MEGNDKSLIKSGNVAILQIAYKDDDDCFRVIIFQVSKLKQLPAELVNLLDYSTITFAGVNVGGGTSVELLTAFPTAIIFSKNAKS